MPKPKDPSDIAKDDLVDFAEHVRDILYGEMSDGVPPQFRYNPDKEWDVEMLELIAYQLERLGLVPGGPRCEKK